jgi:CBS domain-containing protein
MTAEPITVDAGSTRAAAARVMRAYDIHHIPLVQDDRPVGMLHVADEPSPRAPIGLRF